MKKLLSVLLVIAILIGATSFVSVSNVDAAQRVRGYYRSSGMYVQPYYRTSPNSTRFDNYSTRGNYNPYTGRYGTRSPW